jgi:hypothetical protein
MLFGVMMFDVNPIPFFITMGIGHAVIATYAMRDPHLSNLLAAWSLSRRKSTNLVPVKGNKYVA